VFDSYLYSKLACITQVIDPAAESDGVVPTSSAAPSWAAGQHVVEPASHAGLMTSNVVAAEVDSALARLSLCQAATPPVTPTNAFPLSGSIAREPNGSVDVTLNGVLVGGVVQTGLTKANFTIVENGCALPPDQFDLTTGQGHVGVDIVFIQDLSFSMDSEITSVKNSVVNFATSLAAQGLDARFGSVGYSGPGTIPSTPGNAPSEYLGPIQDLTDATTFRNHVASQWVSVGGGDDPENGLEAIEYAMNQLSWRAGAVRILIDITNSSHHTAADDCDGLGPCTDETLASITTLLAGRAVVHVVAPASVAGRTQDGGLDPYLLAAATGGTALDLGSGTFDLSTVGVSAAIAATTRLTFTSASATAAPENLRVLVTINGQTSELAPGLIAYSRVHASLQHR